MQFDHIEGQYILLLNDIFLSNNINYYLNFIDIFVPIIIFGKSNRH